MRGKSVDVLSLPSGVVAEGRIAGANWARGVATTVFWGPENCQLPQECPAPLICSRMLQALQHVLPNASIRTIFAPANYADLPENLYATLSRLSEVEAFEVNDASRDASDRAIKMRMNEMKVLGGDLEAVLLISGDGGFMGAVNDLKIKGYMILIACMRESGAELMYTSGHYAWEWKQMCLGGAPFWPQNPNFFNMDDAVGNLLKCLAALTRGGVPPLLAYIKDALRSEQFMCTFGVDSILTYAEVHNYIDVFRIGENGAKFYIPKGKRLSKCVNIIAEQNMTEEEYELVMLYKEAIQVTNCRYDAAMMLFNNLKEKRLGNLYSLFHRLIKEGKINPEFWEHKFNY